MCSYHLIHILCNSFCFQYTFDCQTGSWWHKSFANVPESELKGLINLDLNSTTPEMHKNAKMAVPSLKVKGIVERHCKNESGLGVIKRFSCSTH